MGSCFIPVGKALTASETDVSSCDKCFFDDKPFFCSLSFCNEDSRTDGKNVVYKLVDIESEKQKVETMRGNINPEYTIKGGDENRIKSEYSCAINSGNSGIIRAGDNSAIKSGDNSVIKAGYCSVIKVGKMAVACGGPESRVAGDMNSILAIFVLSRDNQKIIHTVVDGVTIKPDVFYELKNGKFVESDNQDF